MFLIGQVQQLKLGSQLCYLTQSLRYTCILIPNHIANIVTLLKIGHEQRKGKENSRRCRKVEPDAVPHDDKVERNDAQHPGCAKAEEAACYERAKRKQRQHHKISAKSAGSACGSSTNKEEARTREPEKIRHMK